MFDGHKFLAFLIHLTVQQKFRSHSNDGWLGQLQADLFFGGLSSMEATSFQIRQ